MPAYKSLLSPLKIRNLSIRNRVFSAGHTPSYAVQGEPGERYVAYHREKIRGGVGLTIRDLPVGGAELTQTAWDFLGQPEAPSGRVLFFDQTGAESAMSTAQYLAESGAELIFATPDRIAGQDVGAQNLPVFKFIKLWRKR